MSDQQMAMLRQAGGQGQSPSMSLMKMGAQYAANPSSLGMGGGNGGAPGMQGMGAMPFRQMMQQYGQQNMPANMNQFQGLVPMLPAGGGTANGVGGAPGMGIPTLAQANPVAPTRQQMAPQAAWGAGQQPFNWSS